MTTLPPASVRRRALLGAGTLGLLTACGAAAGASRAGRPARPAAEIDPDTAVRLRELRATEALAARYDAALAAANPATAARLRPLRAQLAAQLTAFGRPPVTATASGQGVINRPVATALRPMAPWK